MGVKEVSPQGKDRQEEKEVRVDKSRHPGTQEEEQLERPEQQGHSGQLGGHASGTSYEPENAHAQVEGEKRLWPSGHIHTTGTGPGVVLSAVLSESPMDSEAEHRIHQ